MRSLEDLVVSWGQAACDEWGYPPLSEDWLSTVTGRLPPGLRQTIAEAVERSSISIVGGHRFSLAGLAARKGPYAFFSRSPRRVPAPNWEYFVQAAEYGRVTRAVEPRGLRVDFEDDLMDVAVYDGPHVVWCIEAKEKARDLEKLLRGLRQGSQHVDMNVSDRHNDPLRKSKYLMRRRPPYFSMVAIGRRLDFSVSYELDGFTLTEDLVPMG
jgi:hypothetical protein